MSEEAYVDEFRRASEAYRKLATEMKAHAAPPTGNGRREKLESMASRVESDAARLKAVVDDYRQLTPPEKFRELHRKMTTFLDLNAAQFGEDAAALRAAARTGRREASPGTVREAALLAAVEDVQAEARRLGLPAVTP